jgi:hypothetical protein
MVRLLVIFWDPSMSLPHLGWLGIDSAMLQYHTWLYCMYSPDSRPNPERSAMIRHY